MDANTMPRLPMMAGWYGYGGMGYAPPPTVTPLPRVSGAGVGKNGGTVAYDNFSDNFSQNF